MGELLGTKELIFDAFLEMTSALGYENVSIRDIANKVGINSASLYYHFESKGRMLEYAYDYYSRHQFDNRTPVDAVKKLVETANADEIVRAFTYTFMAGDEKKYVRLILITKIIYMRLFQDQVANRMIAESNRNNAEYVESVLQYGINAGLIESDFDIKAFAELFIGSRVNMAIRAFADPGYIVGQYKQDMQVLALLARLLATAFKQPDST